MFICQEYQVGGWEAGVLSACRVLWGSSRSPPSQCLTLLERRCLLLAMGLEPCVPPHCSLRGSHCRTKRGRFRVSQAVHADLSSAVVSQNLGTMVKLRMSLPIVYLLTLPYSLTLLDQGR